ncbi:hypothetical protein DRE_00070 [Drechslerella stenobrocha 248]|uniref:Endonuclease/exonuclease/phosphatase domain-containing protein n=1 Tax=Drechslerella stenobrocha 248 TaxID=1043628 RepID=W7IHM7_9PEZI|nr:hypothetical protein DRE_00070 [Drechslerella stenobrocha 248]
MLFTSILSTAVSALLLVPMSLVQAAPTQSGKGYLSVIRVEESVSLAYSTTDPHAKNWVGLYSASGGGPVNEVYVAPAKAWSYATAGQGNVRIDIRSLTSGKYIAFFLARDGYKWLADPVYFNIPAAVTPFAFAAPDVTLHNARVGDAYTAKIGGLLSGSSSGAVTYTKVAGPPWVQVGADGSLQGTPGSSQADKLEKVVISATSGDDKANLSVYVPVRKARSKLVTELRVVTFNLWVGGTHISNYHNKQIQFIVDTNADVIGLQEANRDHVKRLADALGWYFWSDDRELGIISRYPIVEDYGYVNLSGGVRIALDGEASQINFWNAHFTAYPYGPYDACFERKTVAKIIQREAESGRTKQVTDTINAMKDQIKAARTVPVILVGDTNAPSHLDWTEATRSRNCGYAAVQWPTSWIPTQAGLIDSFRVAHPDPVAVPGTTWSPIYPFNQGSTGKVEPQDRIDVIYHSGDLTVVDSEVLVVGKPKTFGSHQNNEWTSDHAAVIAVYKL